MSNQDPGPDKRRNPPPPARPGRSTGRSGRGADSALKQMREWEQRRAAGRTPPDRDKPDV